MTGKIGGQLFSSITIPAAKKKKKSKCKPPNFCWVLEYINELKIPRAIASSFRFSSYKTS